MLAHIASLRRLTEGLWTPLRARAASGWRSLRLGALALALLTAPSTWRRPWRTVLARQLVRAAWPLLPWFALLSATAAVVVIRIVLVSAQSYGLSQVALAMVVRVLVLELIPMSAALVVALRVSLPLAAELPLPRAAGAPQLDWLRAEFAPRVLAGLFSVLLLALVSSLLALLLAYLLAYGATPFALARYTRLVGQVFDPVVALVFVLKTGALALAVAVVPLAAAAQAAPRATAERDTGQMQGVLRMFALVLAIELAALTGSYLR